MFKRSGMIYTKYGTLGYHGPERNSITTVEGKEFNDLED